MDAENLMRKYSRRLDYKRNLRRFLSLSDYPSRRFRKLGCQVGCAENSYYSTLERRRCRNRHDPYFSVVTAPFVFEGTL